VCTFRKSESVIVWGNVIGKSDLERFEWDREKRKKRIFENTRKREREKGDILSLTRVVRLSLSSLSLWRYFKRMRVVSLSLSLSLSLKFTVTSSLCVCVCVYDVNKVPCSYRQPRGNGQFLSRRYRKHSRRLYLCAYRTAQLSHGALAVSRKYFKQSK
jgi:hypothetical protein